MTFVQCDICPNGSDDKYDLDEDRYEPKKKLADVKMN